MAKIVTMGEIMLRLSTPGNEKFIQADEFDINYGGSEANVAVSLANYGYDTEFVTAIPDNPIGDCAVAAMRKYNVGTKFISRSGDRLGIYYLEPGSSVRPSNIVYDRAGSSIACATADLFDFDAIFADADWFHFTGITPALSDSAAKLTEEALKAAKALGKGLPASPGAAAGKIYFTAEEAKAAAEAGDRVILVRLETSPEDIEGMAASQGILTVRGGMTSHAAVVARGMGTCCVSGCEEIKMNEEAKTFTLGGRTFKEGDYISLDGSTGNIYGEDIPTVKAEITGNFQTFMAWADAKRVLKVRTNADTPNDAQTAIDFGAEGIGLTRTEHMFFAADRIMKFRKMIMSDTVEEREAALEGIEPFQKDDFKGIYKAMQERPVTIRLLDPPLHEFMPNTEEEFAQLAEMTGKTVEELKIKARSLHELNPMMGHRGCRLAVSYPEIARMQAKAIMEAAIEVSEEDGINIKPEIMIPLVGEIKELKYVKNIVVETVEKVFEAKGKKLDYLVGTMIEIPRAALTADQIATEAEFFSFGTNDLTQMTYGLSRDDAGKILADYIDKNIYEVDPTARLDRAGVGLLMQWAVEKAKPVRPDIHLGICGEHGGDPYSVEFCHQIGLDYVSCSPYRVPIARLAAAQAQINFPR